MRAHAYRYLAACGLLIATGMASLVAGRRPGPVAVKPPDWAHDLPAQIGRWQGEARPVDKSIMQYLAADAMSQRLYRCGDRAFDFSAVFGTQWRSLHSPAGCYPSQGWQTVTRRQVEVPRAGSGLKGPPLNAEELFVERGKVYRLVLYLYAYPGGTTSSWVDQCMKVARGGVRAGGIVIILGSNCTLASRRKVEQDAFDLLARIYPYVIKGWHHG